ncbi:hypothetical protein O6H91_17G025100 [Diphasiastrum complanatum]|uniref:Uncharacterized protein n=2 Tax=Diphasiastrum complanatum TaxID=34168 RepID=A0ACC2B4Z8_DIPCM|nr:hypothetical protein O6H91_17G020100 [Diphasiastrum complanatum]KAJ7524864.1 hypothetical protein O6H91_17G025100 [Diphasiastrum complanatum]
MRTRRANYPSPTDGITFSIRPSVQKRRRQSVKDTDERSCKVSRVSPSTKPFVYGIDAIPDDLLIAIITFVGSTASSPADLVNAMLTCRRFCAAATHPQVLARAALSALAVKASSWSDGAHRFLKQCADAGNVEASYTLGMIRFYCLSNKGGGASLMAKAAMASHSFALHSLAIIQFNGSGGTRKDKDLKAGVALCARAASLGHVDAMRELGHCLQDGYGVVKNVPEGRRLLLEANAREAAAAVASSPQSFVEVLQTSVNIRGVSCPHHRMPLQSVFDKADAIIQRAFLDHAGILVGDSTDRHPVLRLFQSGGCSLLSDFGCNVPPPKLHVANSFLVDWFGVHPPGCGLRLCSHANCGRPETRKHEFRRCSACGTVNYCSRACQALDWKIRHKYDCSPVADWGEREDNLVAVDGNEAAFEDMDDS